MPRDSGGIYTLPPSNPVVEGDVIDPDWANETLQDIAVQLNNVLTRDGILGPTQPMLFPDGTVSFPAVSFANQPSVGMFRPTLNALAFSTGNSEALRLTSDLISLKEETLISLNTANYALKVTQAGAGKGLWVSNSGAGIALHVNQSGSGLLARFEDSADPDATPIIFDASGNIIVGTDEPVMVFSTTTPRLQLNSTSIGGSGIGQSVWADSTSGPVHHLAKSRGTVIGTFNGLTVAHGGDNLGSINFSGDDGTTFLAGAQIRARAESDFSVGSGPARLEFLLNAGAGLVEAARFDKNGRFIISPQGSVAQATRVQNTTVTPTMQLLSDVLSTGTMSFGQFAYSNDASPSSAAPYHLFARSQGAAIGQHVILGNDDAIGRISWAGSDGVKFVEAARIAVSVHGTRGVDRMPGRITFSVASDAAPSVLQNAMIIDPDMTVTFNGPVNFAGGGSAQVLIPFGTPAAPGLAFSGDDNTGFFQTQTPAPLSNTISLSLAGIERFKWALGGFETIGVPGIFDAGAGTGIVQALSVQGGTGGVLGNGPRLALGATGAAPPSRGTYLDTIFQSAGNAALFSVKVSAASSVPNEVAYFWSSGGTLGGIRVQDGSAGAPSYGFINDTGTNTGMYLHGQNEIGFGANGSGAWFATNNNFSNQPVANGPDFGGTVPTLSITGGNTVASTTMGLARASANASGPIFYQGKSRDAVGVYTTPVILDDALGDFRFSGADTATLRLGARMQVLALETFSPTKSGSKFVFQTADVGGITMVSRLELLQNAANFHGATSNGLVAILEGVATGLNANSNCDTLVLDGKGSKGITFLSDAAAGDIDSINFGDSLSNVSGRITYIHAAAAANHVMQFNVGSTAAMSHTTVQTNILGAARNLNIAKATGSLLMNGEITRFESAEQTILTANGSRSVAHGGNRKPDIIRWVLRCKTAESGYAVGDEINMMNNDTSTADRQILCYSNATNVVLSYTGTAAPIIRPPAGGAAFTITAANWRWVAYCHWL